MQTLPKTRSVSRAGRSISLCDVSLKPKLWRAVLALAAAKKISLHYHLLLPLVQAPAATAPPGMAAADVMRLDAAPTRRQDIISQILSDYGDSRDADEDDVDLDDYYTQAEMSPAPPPAAAPPVQSAPVSPVGKDKPLPPLLGFQLRGGCALMPLLKPVAIVAADILAPGAPCGKHGNCYFRNMAMGAI